VGGSAGGVPDSGEGGYAGERNPVCSGPLRWTHVAETPSRTPRSASALTLASSLAVIETEAGEFLCSGALLGTYEVLVSDCPAAAGDTVRFDARVGGHALLPTDRIRTLEALPGHFELVLLERGVEWYEKPSVPLAPGVPAPGDTITLVSHAPDSLARAARMQVSESTFLERAGAAATDAAFSSDGKLVGFCSPATCDAPPTCVSIETGFQQYPSLQALQAMQSPLWDDVTGDGASDAVLLNRYGVVVNSSSFSGFEPSALWTEAAYFGQRQNMLGDIDADGRADLAVVNDDSMAIRFSSGTQFVPPPTEVSGVLPSRAQLLFGKFDDAPGDDLLIVHGEELSVRSSRGLDLDPSQTWAYIEPSSAGVRVADVTGDGRADAVVVRGAALEVLVSMGSSFAPPVVWLSESARGLPGWFLADVTGDGASDAILVDPERTAVFASDGNRFVATAPAWAQQPSLGERGNAFADMTGDGLADAIVHNHSGVLIYRSTGSGFAAPEVWIGNTYYGGW
jgi:hypothetical protein